MIRWGTFFKRGSHLVMKGPILEMWHPCGMEPTWEGAHMEGGPHMGPFPHPSHMSHMEELT